MAVVREITRRSGVFSQVRDEIVRQAVSQIILRRVPGQVPERQDGYGPMAGSTAVRALFPSQ
jgi:hypothetical protein